MPSQKVDALVQGGKATPAPPLGPALAPLGINMQKIIADINEKTKAFQGMQVPVKIIVDTGTKAYEITVGTPPVSSLLKNEVKLEKLAGHAGTEKVADVKMEQVIKIAMMKEGSLPAKTRKDVVKMILGTCLSSGIVAEGKDPREVIKEVNAGKYDKKITEGKTELSAEELRHLEEEKKRFKEEIEQKKKEYDEKVKNIVGQMKGHKRHEIVKKCVEAGVPEDVAEDLVPTEEGAAPAAGATAPAGEAKAPAKK